MLGSIILAGCINCSPTFIDYITIACERYDIEVNHLIVIGLVESNLNPKAKTRFNKNGTKDVGPFQINSVHRKSTCKEFNIDSLKGNTMCAGKLIAKHSRKAETDPLWLARYHSKTPSKKRKYFKKILKFYKKIPNSDITKELP